MWKKLMIIGLLCAFTVPLIGKETSNMSEKERPVIVMETTQGVIELTLRPDIAPKACENMMKLADKGYYNGVVFHRIIKQFMIQGGDPTGTGAGGQSIYGAPFADEVTKAETFNREGILAMANAGPNTNGSQFFITTAATPWLNMRHTIFGEVTKGHEIVKKLEAVETDFRDRPKVEQKMIKVYVKPAK
jgi:peptidylprolyl isomerase